MTRTMRAAVGAIAIALAAAPIGSAFAGGYGSHNGSRHHGHGYYEGNTEVRRAKVPLDHPDMAHFWLQKRHR